MTANTFASLPAPPPGRTGWPWTVETPASATAASLPKITVVTPSFQQGQFIEETIRSVLLQGYPNLEYLVFDGGSKDDTVAVLKKYDRHLTHWVSEKDRGQSHALNKGIERATGEVFGWLNSDDVLAPGSLQAVGAALAAAKSPGWIVGTCRWKADGTEGELYDSHADAPLYRWLLASPIQQPGSFWHRSLFDRVGAIDEGFRYVMDQDLFLRFRLAGVAPTHLGRELAMFRLHGESKTVATANAFRRETIDKLMPRYLRHVPADQLSALRHETALKLLRNARAELRKRAFFEGARSLARSLWWSPQAVARTALRVASGAMRGR